MTTILLPSSLAIPLDYTSLKDRIAAWMHRSDLSTVLDDFIRFTEERINRTLRVPEMEVALAETEIASGSIAVPDGTAGVRNLWVPGTPNRPLRYTSYASILALETTGTPTQYTRQGDRFYFDGTGDVTGVLYERIAALTSENSANWLLELHPSAYLFGCLAEAHAYVKAPEEAMLWEARFKAVLEDISGNAQRDAISGPLVARAR
jgi:hypothetical protein